MKRITWFLLGVLAIAGCGKESPEDQIKKKVDETGANAQKKIEDAVSQKASEYTKAAKDALVKSAQGAFEEAMKLGAEAPAAALTASKEALGAARLSLDKALSMDSPQRQWITNLDRQIARIDAATLARSLQDQTDEAIKKAQAAGDVASKEMDQARKDLRAKSSSFRELDDRRIAAQKQLADMTERLKQATSYFAK